MYSCKPLNRKTVFFIPVVFFLFFQESIAQTANKNQIKLESWITTADQSSLLQFHQESSFSSKINSGIPSLMVNSQKKFQSVDGFGFTLTGGSAYLINRLPAKEKNSLLQELFGKNKQSIGISYLRISIGASDLNAKVYSYDDLPSLETDTALVNFNLADDSADLVPVLQEILQINPQIKILGTPWSPPVWMKDNGQTMGGHLSPGFYETYARYLVKYIHAMAKKGIRIDAITPQNEPLNDANNPSMVMEAEEQRVFIRNNLGPAFKRAGLKTKIILYDHNCDRPDYPLTILRDPVTNGFIDGSAFHLYAGDISALAALQQEFPNKHLYFTEQWTGSKSNFSEDLLWHTKNVIIGTMHNWCRVALEWNLANDANFEPHTPGGCTECKGALTLGKTIQRNVAYYIIAHASKFVPPGSVRIDSKFDEALSHVAFITPEKKKVLLVVNESKSPVVFNISWNNQVANLSLPASAVATYRW